jgi:superfamily I DNA/RNA helicase
MRDLLPSYELLTPSQHEALRHPHNKSLLVTGPPGSGKTVIALYRAQELKDTDQNIDILVYSNVLYSYLKRALNELSISLNANTQTFHKWFYGYIRRTFNRRPPELKKYEYDWEEITQWYLKKPLEPDFDHLIIDEGQDLPQEFFRFSPYLSQSVTVFADENQAIFQTVNSSIRHIKNALKRFEPKELELKKNHRNTLEIAQFVRLFMTEGIPTGSTDLPDRRGSFPRLTKVAEKNQQIDLVVDYAKSHPNEQIGVFLPRKNDVKRWHKALQQASNQPVQYYVSGPSVSPPDFSKNGILVLTYWSAKGLEFDSVFVPDLQAISSDYKVDDVMRFYVVFSRPRDRLFLSYYGDREPIIITAQLSKSGPDSDQLIERSEYNGSRSQRETILSDEMHNESEFSEPIVEQVVVEPGEELTVDDLREELTISELMDEIEDKLDEDTFNRFFEITSFAYNSDDVINRYEFAEKLKKSLPENLANKILPLIYPSAISTVSEWMDELENKLSEEDFNRVVNETSQVLSGDAKVDRIRFSKFMKVLLPPDLAKIVIPLIVRK